jgi:uncharacterized membrane protein
MPKLKKPSETTSPPAPSRPDWIIAGLALVGLAVAGYLTALKLGGNQAFLCRDGSGCDIVQASRYSLLAGVPTALWGAAVYAAIFVLSVLPGTVRRWQMAFMLAAAAVAFSIYLTYLSIFVIGATCPYCLASGAISLLLLVTMLVRRPVAQGRVAQAYTLKRLAGLGITDILWRLLVTRVQRAKGPVRVCRGALAVRGMQSPRGSQDHRRALREGGGARLPHLDDQRPEVRGRAHARATGRALQVPLHGSGGVTP